MSDIDQILEKCGSFSRYQFMLMGFFCLINILCSFHYYSQTIISFVPKYWCLTNVTANLSMHELRQSFAKSDDNQCITSTGSKCNEWIYDYDSLYGYRSMTSEYNWICENAWKSITGQSFYFIGSVVGTLIGGILADFYGRLKVLIAAHLFGIVGNFMTIFATNEITFSLYRFISGIATDNNFVMMYILVLEYISPKMRTFGLNLCIGIFYCLGSVVSPWIAVYLNNWKLYLLATIIPAIIVPSFYFILQDSAQWLISKNKPDEALACYQKIAKFNGRQLDDKFNEDFRNFVSTINAQTKSIENKPNLLSLFKTPRLRRLTLILFLKSMIITLNYDAISKNVEGLDEISPFTLFSLSAFAILPASIVILLFQDKIGRKAMASASLLVSGVFIGCCSYLLAYQKNCNPAFFVASGLIIARFFITVSYNSGAQYATELIPTCVRAQGVSAAHVAGYAFTFISPYILYTATFFKAMPSLILATLSFCAAVCCLFLPETLNRKIPISLEDGENFGKEEKFYHFACFERNKKEKNSSTFAP